MQKLITSSLIALLTLFITPVLIPIRFIAKRIKRSRVYREVSHRDCSECGNHLGADSLARASQQFKTMVQEFKNKYPSMRINFGRPFAAICTHCDCHYDYDPVEKVIVPTPTIA